MPEVRARMVDGQPVLQLLDGDDASVRMAWRLPRDGAVAQELRGLFRELFLAGARERLVTDGGLHHAARLPKAQG